MFVNFKYFQFEHTRDRNKTQLATRRLIWSSSNTFL